MSQEWVKRGTLPDLTPGTDVDIEEIVDQAVDEVQDELEPTVDLVVLFENALA